MNPPRICLLGEPRLVFDGDQVTISGRPGRVLVSLLAHDGGRTLEQLAESVWLGTPPKTARSALHVHLGTLRKILTGVPPGLDLDRHGDRYLVTRAGWELDVELVGSYEQEAAELATSDPRAAAACLRDALNLWAGEPFTVAGTEISPVAAYRLQLHRLELEERLVEALLEAGEPAQAEALAVELVDAEPYRERRWSQLMRALTSQGRSVEALTAYERAREILLAELGIPPGDELARLERSILTHNVSAATSQFWPPVDLDDVPSTLGPLVGRERLLEQVETALARPVPVVICGAPGAGKTRLAIETARQASSTGQVVGWVDLRNSTFDTRAFDDAVVRWSQQNPAGLIVLDNAEQAVDSVRERVSWFVRSSPSVRVLVTSRVPIDGGAAVVTVDPLTVPVGRTPDDVERSESVQLFRSLVDILAPGVEIDTGAVADLCRDLGGLPLAIRLAADLARSVPISSIASASRARLSLDLAGGVASILAYLGPHHGDAFAAMSIVAGQLDEAMVAALIGGTDRQPVVSTLVDHGLVQFTGGVAAPYSVPEPLREVGQSMLTDRDRRSALDRLTDECLRRAIAQSEPVPIADTGDPFEVALNREMPWHRQALDHLANIHDDRRALDLVAALDLQLYSLGLWKDNVELQDIALAIPGPPSSSRAHLHAIRGRPGQFHQFEARHNLTALEMALDIGDPVCEARAEYHLGVMDWWVGNYDLALERFARTRSLAEGAGNTFLVGEAMRFTGIALATAGDFERGLATQLDLIHLVERVPQLELFLPHLYMYVGHSRRHLGDLEAALADLGRARDVFVQIDNRASLIHVYAGLAEVYADLGQYDESLRAAAGALDVSARAPIDVYDPWTFCITARVHVETGDGELARLAASRAIDALAHTYHGETHRVAAELAYTAYRLGENQAALRLVGLAEATPDRRELPLGSPNERRRVAEARDSASAALGGEAGEALRMGATSSVTEAAARLIHPR